jgi:hypothetical protein
MDKSPLAFAPFAAKALAWMVFGFIASRRISEQPTWLIVLSVFIFAAPVAMSGAYSSAVNQVQRLSYFKEGGWAYRLLSRRFFATLLWLIWAVPTSFFLLLQFSMYSRLEWLALAIAILVFWVTFSMSYRFLFTELKKPYTVTNLVITWARRISSLAMLAICIGLTWAFGNTESYGTLTEALAAKRIGIVEGSGSALVDVALRLLTFSDGLKAYLVSRFKDYAQAIPLVLLAVSALVVFYNAAATFSCFAIESKEYRRIFGPLTADDVPPPLSNDRVALISAAFTFVTLFIYLPLFGHVEDTMRRHPEVIATVKAVEKKVEQIDKDYYKPGTIEKIQTAKAVLLGKLNVSKATLDGQVNRAFALMEGNVDGYLDWYYSLSAEYMRLGKLLIGEIEGYMEEKLSEYLQKGDPSGEIERGIKAALSTHQAAMDEFQLAVKGILDSNRISTDGNTPAVSSYISLNDMMAMPIHADLVALDTRAAGSTVAAGIVGVVTGKIASKIIFKTAVKAVAKAATAKAVGTAAGAGIGFAIGSVVPVVGTVIGGLIGGVVGGVAMDAGLLKLEEAISREDFKKEILASIRHAQEEFKSKLFSQQ